MLDHAIGPNVIANLSTGMTEFLERIANRGWTSLTDFRGIRRGNVVAHSQIGRPDASEYHGGYQEQAVAMTSGSSQGWATLPEATSWRDR